MPLKLKAPDALPADGVTTVAFKAWKNTLFSFLEQDTENYLFLAGGIYATWTPQIDVLNRQRIASIHADDPEKRKLQRRLQNTNDSNPYSDEDLQEDLQVLLLKRNSQLSKFIQLICAVCHYTEHDDISSLSTSTTWIISYLEQHYNLEKKGAHFLKVSELSYKENTNHQTFYREFRSAIYDNLKKSGHKIKYLNDKELDQDEIMSPTFEETIVLWCLEKIDPRLPAHVNKTFGHQMTGNTTLKDLQVMIFQRIPGMLEELNEAESNRATMLNNTNACSTANKPQDAQEPTLSAYRMQNRSNRQQRFNKQAFNTKRRTCTVCRLAGRPNIIADSHTASNCRLKDAILNASSITNDLGDDLDTIPFCQEDEEEEYVQ